MVRQTRWVLSIMPTMHLTLKLEGQALKTKDAIVDRFRENSGTRPDVVKIIKTRFKLRLLMKVKIESV